jgi:hypothetical protein
MVWKILEWLVLAQRVQLRSLTLTLLSEKRILTRFFLRVVPGPSTTIVDRYRRLTHSSHLQNQMISIGSSAWSSGTEVQTSQEVRPGPLARPVASRVESRAMSVSAPKSEEDLKKWLGTFLSNKPQG